MLKLHVANTLLNASSAPSAAVVKSSVPPNNRIWETKDDREAKKLLTVPCYAALLAKGMRPFAAAALNRFFSSSLWLWFKPRVVTRFFTLRSCPLAMR